MVRPLGFDLSDAQLRRAGLDYHDLASVTAHDDLGAAWQAVAGSRVFAFTTRAATRYTDIHYLPGDVLLFGRESTRAARCRARGQPRDLGRASADAARAAIAQLVEHRRCRGLRGAAAARLRRRGLNRTGRGSAMTGGLPRIDATRYVTPLREGGSLPGIVEASDLGTYVMKFFGAGQGPRVLVAEVVVAGIARALGLRVPELAAVTLSPDIARYEADQEVQELLNASIGVNLGIDFLPGSFGFDSSTLVEAPEAATIIWLDAFVANVDRSWQNPNLLRWHGRIWCIDHGAALYFHHGWQNGVGSPERFAGQPYDVSAHVLAAFASAVPFARCPPRRRSAS